MNKEVKKNETANKLDEMMVSIRKNVKPSPSTCITNFENLLKEIDSKDKRITNIFIREVSNFLNNLFKLFHEVDKISSKEIKAKMLTREFINIDSYFKKSKSIANRLMRMRAGLEYFETEKHKLSRYTKDTSRNIIKLNYKEAAELDHSASRWYNGSKDVNWTVNFKEMARKTMLLYYHIPAIYKALIQTKRREIGLDCNSKKFG